MCPSERAMFEEEQQEKLKKIKVLQGKTDDICAGKHIPPGYVFSVQFI